MKRKKKADNVFSKVSRKKLARLLSGDGSWGTNALPEIGVQAVTMNDGPLGLRVPNKNSSYDFGGIKTAACFPAPSLSACSWDRDLLVSLGKGFAYEAIEKGADIVLTPGINIKRNPLCGRNFEYYSEDPVLAGELGASFINGIQSEGVGASLKHFAANNCESHRFLVSSEIDMRALMEIYLKGFEIAVKKSNPWTVMCSYNRLNGVYASQNEWLLDTILRKEWGYDGVVVSDWGAVLDPVSAHARGLDLEMPSYEPSRASLIAKAVKRGEISQERFESEVTHLISLSEKAKKRPHELPDGYFDGYSHELAKKVALESVVLAKNDGVLPLKSLKGCCIIGPYAKEPHYKGFGSAEVNASHVANFYDEASKRSGSPIPYAKGFDPKGKEDAEALRLDAIDKAANAKVALVFLGCPPHDDEEGYDRKDMRLSADQTKLIEGIVAQNKNVIVFVSGGAPLELPFVSKIRAVFLTYVIGEAGGEALVNLLLGDANPSGHLAETWPLHYLDCPSSLFFPRTNDVSLYKESIFVGYRYYLSAKREVLFPFGHGLSYTTFKISKMTVPKTKMTVGGSLKATCTVKNTGKRDGAAVIQCYISFLGGKHLHPKRELKDFAKVWIKAGETATVSFDIPYDCFRSYSESSDSWRAIEGSYQIEIGQNCEDIEVSREFKVVSGFKEQDRRYLLPSYYTLPSNGAWRISDAEFEILLGHSVTKNRRRKGKKFTRNSTFRDIEHTLVGKIVKKKLVHIFKETVAPELLDREIEIQMDTPLRFALAAGFKEKQLKAILSMANKRPLGAIMHLIFG